MHWTPEINLPEFRFTLANESRERVGTAVAAIVLNTFAAQHLEYVTMVYPTDDGHQTEMLAAHRLSRDSYQRICDAIGVEP